MKVKCINADGAKPRSGLRKGDIYTVFQMSKDLYYIEELETDYRKTRFSEVEKEGG